MGSTGCFLFNKPAPAPAPAPAAAAPSDECATPTLDATPEGVAMLSLEDLRSEQDLVGQTVYSLVHERNPKGKWISMGQPFAVCSVTALDSTTTTNDGEKYTLNVPARLHLAAADGTRFDLGVANVSTTRPLISMKEPGQVDAFLNGAFLHAYDLQKQRNEIWKNSATTMLVPAIKAGGEWEINWDYYLQQGLNEAGKATGGIVADLVQGRRSRENVLRDELTAWAAEAEDDRFVDWLSDGPSDAKVRKAGDEMVECLQAIDGANGLAASLASIEDERREKPWRRDLEGTSEKKLAKLDASKEKNLDERKAQMEATMNERLSSKSCPASVAYAKG